MSNRYFHEKDRSPKTCWSCDRTRGCKCPRTFIRAAKRGAKQLWRKRVSEEINDAR